MEQQYTVSARKFRPDTFEKVVGQKHITNTLKNALLNKCIAQAFLFCGPRGVGKTTCARILAKAINCENLTPQGEPCNNCSACQRSMIKESGGVFELDAASNNSVDDIRMLVEQVRYVPQVDKYKVYIIDEVHMLSNAAFNAFLKTLEEPPKHAIFILATTEKHKIIPTILSRCQVFDFRRVKTVDIVSHLEYVAKMREIKYEIEALYVLAEKADGGLRDALSLLDMVASFESNATIHYKNVIENLHIIDYEYYFQIVDRCWNQDIKNCLIQFSNIIEKGFDGQNFISGLAIHLRNLLVIKYDEFSDTLLDVSEKVKNLYKDQSKIVSVDFLLKTLEITTRYDFQYKNSYNKRLLVELMLIAINTEKKEEGGGSEQKNILTIKNVSGEGLNEKKKIIQSSSNEPKKTLYIDKEPEKPLVMEKSKIEESKSKSDLSSTPKSIDSKNNIVEVKTSRPGSTIKIPKLDNLSKEESAQNITIIKDDQVQGTNINTILTLCDTENLIKLYAQKFLEDGRITEYNTLMSRITVENSLITFFFSNSIQKSILNELKPSLMTFLKKELNFNFLQIEDYIEAKVVEKKPYTAQEKLNYLIEKYPIVENLVQKLSLVPN